MKRFTTNLLLFLCSFFLLTGTVIFFEKLTLRNEQLLRLPDSKKYLFMGHSHAQAAYFDKVIDSALNVASAGESYFYTYIKLKGILAQNDSKPVIFMEYSNNNIISEMNKWIWDDVYIQDRYRLYSAYADFNEIKLLYRYNPKSAFVCDMKSVINNIYYIFRHRNISEDDNKMGGYFDLNRHVMDSILPALKGKENDGRVDTSFSEVNILYLRKIIDYCHAHNTRVILVRSPLHKLYSGLGNEARFREVLASRLGDVPFIDLRNFPLADSDFGDLEHLSESGARKYSSFFNSLLKDGLLEKKDMQQFAEAHFPGKDSWQASLTVPPQP